MESKTENCNKQHQQGIRPSFKQRLYEFLLPEQEANQDCQDNIFKERCFRGYRQTITEATAILWSAGYIGIARKEGKKYDQQ